MNVEGTGTSPLAQTDSGHSLNSVEIKIVSRMFLVFGCWFSLAVASDPIHVESEDVEKYWVLVHSEAPRYPTSPYPSQQKGYVEVVRTISAEGRVVDIEILSSNPPRAFDRAAIGALESFTYKPAPGNAGRLPIRGRFVITVGLE